MGQATAKLRTNLIDQMQAFEDLKINIENLMVLENKEFKLMTNLGSNVYAHAKPQDPNNLYISVGLGFHIECSLNESLTIIRHKIKNLETQVDLYTAHVYRTRS